MNTCGRPCPHRLLSPSVKQGTVCAWRHQLITRRQAQHLHQPHKKPLSFKLFQLEFRIWIFFFAFSAEAYSTRRLPNWDDRRKEESRRKWPEHLDQAMPEVPIPFISIYWGLFILSVVLCCILCLIVRNGPNKYNF